MKQVRKIWLEEVTSEVLQALVRHQGLRIIEGNCWRHGGYQTHPKVVLDTMDPRLLAKAVTKMEKLKLVCALLTFRQVEVQEQPGRSALGGVLRGHSLRRGPPPPLPRQARLRTDKKRGRDGTKYSKFHPRGYLSHHLAAISMAAVL